MTPSWLYYGFAVLMLVVAAYCLVRLIVALVVKQVAGWDVDISHIFMGVSMAGMFVVSWAFGSSLFWELVFGVFLVWFILQTIQALRFYGPHLPHYAIHATMAFAMLLMYWFPGGSGTSGSSMMSSSSSMMSASGHKADAGLLFLLAVILLASAVRSLGSSRRGIAHYGTHTEPTIAGHPARCNCSGCHCVDLSNVGGFEAAVLNPAVGDVAHAAMCIAMAFMLILMI